MAMRRTMNQAKLRQLLDLKEGKRNSELGIRRSICTPSTFSPPQNNRITEQFLKTEMGEVGSGSIDSSLGPSQYYSRNFQD